MSSELIFYFSFALDLKLIHFVCTCKPVRMRGQHIGALRHSPCQADHETLPSSPKINSSGVLSPALSCTHLLFPLHETVEVARLPLLLRWRALQVSGHRREVLQS